MSDWTKLAGRGAPGAPSTPNADEHVLSLRRAECSASASYSSRYHDYDVYVHSNQPSRTVTVSDDSGRTASYHTDASGYADVYFKAPASAAGEHGHRGRRRGDLPHDAVGAERRQLRAFRHSP